MSGKFAGPGWCECCDHPLQHAIRRALDAAANGVPTKQVLTELQDSLNQWEDDR